ncbi:apolipoprotein N-acyltransferase [Roseateles oligotrophus]|uniref:Apolipoprotein N-acyltransferase n=1 Tax=Roseateles oligotrophus TaxID=1769250 RepID=A0ABT2YID3_9BURK|nr:apolipoprotein N-acyltransferase [Roseateles oligotrophus]MCV2369773.1 apolipoprotein N-acyltransferase [Roseateles oligotrophus]
MRLRFAAPLVLLAGVIHTAAFAPLEAWYLQIFALALLARLTWSATPRQAALLGGLFGLAWMSSGFWWIHVSLHQFGHLPWPLAAIAVLLLAAFLSCYYAGAMALAARLTAPDAKPFWRMAVWSACWLLAELGRATLLTGFPWIAAGYAHTVGPLAAWAPWIGVYGISALAAAIALALAGLSLGSWRPAAAMLALLGLGSLLPQDFSRSTGVLRVSLLQPNVAQDQKFDRDLMDANLERLALQIEAARGQVVVTPESVVPLPLDYLDAVFLQRMERVAQQRPILLGSFLGDERRGYVNSLVGFGGPQAYDYGKRHLLPFGEFIPPGFHWFVSALRIPLDDQARGQHQRSFDVAGQRLRPLICYEDLFGEDFVGSVVGEQAATLLVNVSNLAWFGTLMVQDQHLQFSQMRALEFQRPVIRATNTGATAVVNHRGLVTARLAPAVAGLLEAEVEGRSGSTPYARWLQAFGQWPLWLAVTLVLGLAWWRRRAS